MEIITWIGLSQSLFAGFIIASKKKKAISDMILSVWLLLLGVTFLINGISNQLFDQPLPSNSFLLFNPAFYLYIKSLTDRDFKIKWIQLLHMFPFILFQTLVHFKKFQLSYSPSDFSGDELPFTLIYGAAAILSWLVYNSISLLLVHRHRKSLKNEFSTIEDNEKIAWILFVAIFYASFCTFMAAFGLYTLMSGSGPYMLQGITYGVFLFMVYVLGYYGLKQEGIFRNQPIRESVKYENSVLTPAKKSEIKKSIIQIFENNQAYLNPDFCLDMLAGQSGYPKHQITEVLNTELEQNFFQLVNSYRVEEVKNHLRKKNDQYSIEAIGYECGFNSKSSFYTVFKRNTGKTPSQFRDSIV